MKTSRPCKAILSRLDKLARKPLAQATAMPPEMYLSDEILALEKSRIFRNQWLCAGRTAQLDSAGAFLTYELDQQPIVIVRQKDGSIKAFANVCRHRMMTLVEGSGQCKKITCPYHAWTYAIDGKLVAAPHMDQRRRFDKSKLGLKQVRCEVWQGWIYVTLNNRIASVSRKLAQLAPLVAPYKMENYVQIASKTHLWKCNWKQLTENFMEGYHLPVAHKATVGGFFPVEETRFGDKSYPAFTYQFFIKTDDAPVGIAHPDNKRLKGKQRGTSILPTVFPSHMFMLAPDHLWYLSLQPVAAGEVRIHYGAAVAPEVLASQKKPKQYINEVSRFLDRVNEEDRIVVEGIYRGASAPMSEAGPLSWLEKENHDFTRYLARQLCR